MPDNRVDVLLTTRDHGIDNGTGGGATTTLLQNVEVLAVDRRLDKEEDGETELTEPKSVTLLVTPDQAAKLDLGMNMGTLHLSLRNPEDERPRPTLAPRHWPNFASIRKSRYRTLPTEQASSPVRWPESSPTVPAIRRRPRSRNWRQCNTAPPTSAHSADRAVATFVSTPPTRSVGNVKQQTNRKKILRFQRHRSVPAHTIGENEAMRILIAGDNELTKAKVRDAARHNGFECDEADVTSLDKAAERAGHARHDFVVVILTRSTEEGLDAIREISSTSHAAILAVGPTNDSDLILRAMRDGAVEYVGEAELPTQLKQAILRLEARQHPRSADGKVVAVVSPSGGTGASTLAANPCSLFGKNARDLWSGRHAARSGRPKCAVGSEIESHVCRIVAQRGSHGPADVRSGAGEARLRYPLAGRTGFVRASGGRHVQRRSQGIVQCSLRIPVCSRRRRSHGFRKSRLRHWCRPTTWWSCYAWT